MATRLSKAQQASVRRAVRKTANTVSPGAAGALRKVVKKAVKSKTAKKAVRTIKIKGQKKAVKVRRVATQFFRNNIPGTRSK